MKIINRYAPFAAASLMMDGRIRVGSAVKFAEKATRLLAGMMSFIYQIRSVTNSELFTTNQLAFSKLYTQFLDYQSFYGINQPRIICEGKTDNIYLRAAMKRLAS